MISAVILTKNEEKNIKDCLSGLSWCDEIIVIDDRSIDKTRQIASLKGAKVIVHELNQNFSLQRNFALKQTKGDWVLFVDADERVSSALENEIKNEIKKADKDKVNGFYLKRNDFFMGKWLRFGEIGGIGGWGGIKILRLAKKGSGEFERSVDEIWKVRGKTKNLRNPLLHYSHPSLKEFLQSINEKSTQNAKEFYEKGVRITFFEWIKPKAKFLVNYFLKLGFLDGIQGFVFALLMSLHSFMVRGKLYLLWKKGK